MLLQLTGFIFDCTCIILPTPIVHIDNYCYLYYSTLFSPFTALYFILYLSYTLKKGHCENKPFIHLFYYHFCLWATQGGGGKQRRSTSPLENKNKFLYGIFSLLTGAFSPCGRHFFFFWRSFSL